MMTFEEAMRETEFHRGQCRRIVGPRGGVRIVSEVWRRNGRTLTWKTRPGEFEIPIKRGLYEYGRIRSSEAVFWHTPAQCPLNQEDQS